MVTPLSLFDLAEAFAKDGCPVCRLTRHNVESYLHGLLFEGIIHPENHDAFRVSRGLCNAHAWLLADFKGALLNTAVYYRGTLNDLLKDLDASGPAPAARGGLARLMSGGKRTSAVADRLEPHGPCMACKVRATSEELYTRTIGEHIQDERLAKPYRGSQGVCLPHFRMALRHATSATDERTLVDIQRAIWEALRDELDRFKEMHDHHHTGEYMGDEGDSWLRVLRAMAGEQGMFGVDRAAEE
jgi:hypothetical protein